MSIPDIVFIDFKFNFLFLFTYIKSYTVYIPMKTKEYGLFHKKNIFCFYKCFFFLLYLIIKVAHSQFFQFFARKRNFIEMLPLKLNLNVYSAFSQSIIILLFKHLLKMFYISEHRVHFFLQ